MKTKRERERGETMISDLKFRITDLKIKCCLGRNLNIEILDFRFDQSYISLFEITIFKILNPNSDHTNII